MFYRPIAHRAYPAAWRLPMGIGENIVQGYFTPKIMIMRGGTLVEFSFSILRLQKGRNTLRVICLPKEEQK